MSNRYKYIDENRQHLHTLDGKPLIGASTACGIIAKNLVWWSAECAAVELLSTGAEKIPTIRAEYKEAKKITDPKEAKKALDALQKKYPPFKRARFAHYEAKNDAADTGTDMHAELEKYVKACIATNNGEPLAVPVDIHEAVAAFAGWANENIKKFVFSEGYCYSERLWMGGICDAGAILKDDSLVTIDFKSAKSAYFDHFIQTAFYDIMISENGVLDKDGNQLLPSMKANRYMVVPFGTMPLVPKLRFDTGVFQQAAEAAITLYRHSLNYEN